MAFRKYNFFKKFLDFLTGFGAFLTILLIIFNFVCNRFGYFDGRAFMVIFAKAQGYALYAVLFLAGLEFFTTKNWFLLTVFILVAAVAAIMLFAPQWVESFLNIFKRG